MKPTPDDPKLTAYALGELNETERKELEAALKGSPECRQAVEDIRQAATLLKTELASEALPEMDFVQQRAVEAKLKPRAEKRQTPLWWRILFYGSLSAGTCLIIGMLLLPSLAKSKGKSTYVAKLNEQRVERLKAVEQRAVSSYAVNSAPPPSAPTTVPPPVLEAAPIHEKLDQKSGNQFALSASTPQLPGSVATVAPQPAQNGHDASVVGSVNFANSAGSQIIANGGKADGPNLDVVELSLAQNSSPAPAAKPQSPAWTKSANPQGYYYGDKVLGDDAAYVRGRILVKSESKKNLGELAALQRNPRSIEGDRYDRLDEQSVRQRWSAESELPNTASYPHLIENSFLNVLQNPLSTFSIDVDTASYANVRRFLTSGQLPPVDAVRIEEMVNYFTYNYPQPRGDDPFSANVEVAGCPWNSEHRLVRVGLKGREIAQNKRPPSNFVFLIDVSGSMEPQERLPLIKQALRQLVKKMTPSDRVAIVVYASAAGVRLQSTSCTQKEKILEAIDSLGAGGSTAGGAGIQAAYDVASENFIKGGVNRVILCTDGDFNVGIIDQGQLVKLIQEKAKTGVFLTTLGVGTDNYKDALMQKLADKGNGNYHYLDTLEEAQKVLIDQMSGTLVTIAKDVKIQIEFNPSQVGAYRLIGYEKRMLRKEDFNNDKKDAGEIGAGHTVTALYEITPPGREDNRGAVDDLKYQSQPAPEEKPERYVKTGSRELLTLKLRYKQPNGDKSKLLEFPVTDGGKSYGQASVDFKFATAVAEFGMLLRQSEFKGSSSFGQILELAGESKGHDEAGYRSEFIELVKKAKRISNR